ncbi:MAG TPA: TlpA disulfide reductase family protein [Bryobacteraceae bacterium]|nr:TlpA disulfide reductase family protein [Bryobacteraceae bacterium]
MNTVLRQLSGVAAIAFGMSAATAMAQNLDGRWDATTVQGGVSIPFRLDLSGEGDHLVGTLYNGGGDKETTTSASLKDGKLILNFEHYLTAIDADVKGQELDGKIVVSRRGRNTVEDGANPTPKPDAGSPFRAVRYVAPAPIDLANVPSIDGQWEIPHESNKGEKAWRLIVKQTGADVETTILRVDGDTGGAYGRWQNGKFVASHFDGARPGLIVLTPQADGTLQVDLNAGQRTGVLTAYRPEVARAKGLPEPSNYQTHTTVRDPNETFAWSFPDTRGKVTSNDDPKFKGKVVLAIVTGTWCPNCHDEAKYLVELYAKYHDRGLEIVALDFEEPDQQSSLKRVNAFIKQYHVPYTYVIAGAPEDMWDKIPQAVNLNTWPATFFVGRDGKVKATHAGFAGPASGEFNAQLKTEFTSTIERLLGENGAQKTE